MAAVTKRAKQKGSAVFARQELMQIANDLCLAIVDFESFLDVLRQVSRPLLVGRSGGVGVGVAGGGMEAVSFVLSSSGSVVDTLRRVYSGSKSGFRFVPLALFA